MFNSGSGSIPAVAASLGGDSHVHELRGECKRDPMSKSCDFLVPAEGWDDFTFSALLTYG